MPFVVYATPFFSDNANANIDALLNLEGVRLAIVSQAPQEEMPLAASARLVGHWRVNDILSTADLLAGVEALQAQFGRIDRLFSATEQIQVQVAEVREKLGIVGMSAEVAKNFRDKARMKTLLRAAGLPCARHRLVTNLAEAMQFADEIGFPLVIKPPDGAGAQATYRADNAADLSQALAAINLQPGQEALLEEFITGEEHSFDTWTIAGQPVFYSLTHYLPSPLDAMRNRWIQWAVLLPREVDDPRYDAIRTAAFGTLKTLGMQTGLSHLEWFRRTDGSIAISEVAARPPGAQITTLISRAHDFDSLDAWSRLLVYDEFAVPERRYAVGAAFLRGQGTGVVRAVYGLDTVEREVGHLITDRKLPTVGQVPSPSYEGEGYIIVRDADTATVRQALARIVESVYVELG